MVGGSRRLVGRVVVGRTLEVGRQLERGRVRKVAIGKVADKLQRRSHRAQCPCANAGMVSVVDYSNLLVSLLHLRLHLLQQHAHDLDPYLCLDLDIYPGTDLGLCLSL